MKNTFKFGLLKKVFLGCLIGIFSSLNLVQAGLVSALFEDIPLEASLRCDRILLKSSAQNPNAAVLIPHFIPGSLLEGKDAYTVRMHPKPFGDKKYLLNIRIFFPSHDDLALSGRSALSKSDLNTCDWDHVRSVLNRNRPPSEKIHTISKASLSAIEMTIPGIEAKATIDSVDSKESDIEILEYSGKFITLTFPISETENRYFQDHVVLKNGLQANVKLFFQTRNKENAFTVRLNKSEVLNNFNGQFSGGPMKLLTQAELSIAVQKSIQNTKLEVIQEGSLSPEEEKLKIQVTQQVLEQLNAILIAPKDNSGSTTPMEKPSAKTISVKAAAELISKSVKTEFSFANYSAPITAKVKRQVELASYRTNDPNIIEVKLIPRESDPATGIEVKAGQMISVALAYFQNDKMRFVVDKRYVSLSQLNDFKFRDAFPSIRDQNCPIKNEEVNNETFAANKRSILCPHKYRWGYIQRHLVKQTVSSGTAILETEKFDTYPIFLSFEGLNKSKLFTFTDLHNSNNEYFSAHFESISGRMFILAKRNLGRLYMRVRAKDGTDYLKVERDVKINTEAIFQESYNILGNLAEPATEVEIKSTESYVSHRRTMTFYVSRPQLPSVDDLKFLKSLPSPVAIPLR